MWTRIKYVLYTEVDLLSRRLNAYRDLWKKDWVEGKNTATMSLSTATAIESRLGNKAAQKREKWIDALFRLVRNQDTHCYDEMVNDGKEARQVYEVIEHLK